MGSDSLVIGKSRVPMVECSLTEIPHLLVAGETGGGKSTFLRQMITTLYLKNPGYKFTLIDLKGGLEFQTFEGLERVVVESSANGATSRLKNLANKVIEDRKQILKANNCKDLNAFKKIPKKDVVFPDGVERMGNLDRLITVVDEGVPRTLNSCQEAA